MFHDHVYSFTDTNTFDRCDNENSMVKSNERVPNRVAKISLRNIGTKNIDTVCRVMLNICDCIDRNTVRCQMRKEERQTPAVMRINMHVEERSKNFLVRFATILIHRRIMKIIQNRWK